MRKYVRILPRKTRKLRTFVLLLDALQAGGHRFEPGTLHSVTRSRSSHLAGYRVSVQRCIVETTQTITQTFHVGSPCVAQLGLCFDNFNHASHIGLLVDTP